MIIEQANESHIENLTNLAFKLWPENDWSGLREEFFKMLQSTKDRFYLAKMDEMYIGFIHLSIRSDYVEGSHSSPVGYIEGIFVQEPYRRKGVSKKLVESGEAWLKSQGCKEIASDTEVMNTNSQLFHEKLGFREAGRIIAYIKKIH